MSNRVLTLLFALAAGLVAFGAFYWLGDDAALRRAAREGDALAWLRIEFKLSDAQFKAIKQLHTDYTVECSGHCAAIMAAKERKAPALEVSQLEQACVASIRVHFQRVAALMPPSPSVWPCESCRRSPCSCVRSSSLRAIPTSNSTN